MVAPERTAAQAAELEAAAGDHGLDADRTGHDGTAVVAWWCSVAVNEDLSADGAAPVAADDGTAERERSVMTPLSVGWPTLQLDLRHSGKETHAVRGE